MIMFDLIKNLLKLYLTFKNYLLKLLNNFNTYNCFERTKFKKKLLITKR